MLIVQYSWFIHGEEQLVTAVDALQLIMNTQNNI